MLPRVRVGPLARPGDGLRGVRWADGACRTWQAVLAWEGVVVERAHNGEMVEGGCDGNRRVANGERERPRAAGKFGEMALDEGRRQLRRGGEVAVGKSQRRDGEMDGYGGNGRDMRAAEANHTASRLDEERIDGENGGRGEQDEAGVAALAADGEGDGVVATDEERREAGDERVVVLEEDAFLL